MNLDDDALLIIYGKFLYFGLSGSPSNQRSTLLRRFTVG